MLRCLNSMDTRLHQVGSEMDALQFPDTMHCSLCWAAAVAIARQRFLIQHQSALSLLGKRR